MKRYIKVERNSQGKEELRESEAKRGKMGKNDRGDRERGICREQEGCRNRNEEQERQTKGGEI